MRNALRCCTLHGDARDWIATAFSPRPYHPFALGNGSECITIDYTGSMFSGMNGHAHKEQHQALIPGWYVNAHRTFRIPPGMARSVTAPSQICVTQPVIQAGYNIVVDGQIGDPQYFCQAFDPAHAILTTHLIMLDVQWRVTACLTDEHIWEEQVEMLAVPRGKKVDLVFFIWPFTHTRLQGLAFGRQSVLRIKPAPDSGVIAFNWRLAPNGRRGQGLMWCAPRGRVEKNTIVFENVQRGFAAACCRMIAGKSSQIASSGGMAGRLHGGVPAAGRVRRRHIRVWEEYSSRSSVVVPDAGAGGLYDLSMYWMRSNQHPETGSLNLGPFPCHWGGGCNALPDAWIMQMALLKGNHLDESRRLLEFYRRRMPRARRVARDLDAPGARLCCFSSALGEDMHDDPERIRHEFVGQNTMACYSLYDHWLISGRDDYLSESLAMMRELLEHVLAVAVIEKDDRAYIGVTKPSDESAGDVTNDSLISIRLTRVLRGYCEMSAAAGLAAPAAYRKLADKLAVGLRENYRAGILAPYKHARVNTCALLYFIWNLPDGINRKTILDSIRRARTPWGGDSDMYSEKYRNWPWHHMWASIVYSYWDWSAKAFGELQYAMKDCSSLGAIPEKIRMDGYPINYWYTSAHAYYLWAFQNALGHDRKGEVVALLPGMDGTWRDLQFSNLRLQGGLLVSLEAENACVRKLTLRNDGIRPLRRKLALNPKYSGSVDHAVSLAPGQRLRLV